MDTKIHASIASHFDAILDVLSEGVYITDTAGKTLYVNRMYEQLTGYKLAQLGGVNVRDLLDNGAFDIALNPEIVKTHKPSTRVQRLKNGKTLVLSGYPVFGENGELCFVVTFARDITVLQELNSRVAHHREMLKATQELQHIYLAKEKKDSDIVMESASPAMNRVLEMVDTLAQTDATVLILGETGVGKDVIARLLHGRSFRGDKLPIKVDCGGIAESLIESELFGYVAGAFTGASSKGKAGYFEIASGSTIFLDEIGELPMTMQTRLLRVLQDGVIQRVGSTAPKKVDVRIIAATNRNLEDCIREGTFRSDLYYRLNVATINIPPLRERPEDIDLLASKFLNTYSAKYRKTLSFKDETMAILRSYSWPGNVRQLQNLVHSMVITAKGAVLSPDELPASISGIRKEEHLFSDYLKADGRSLHDIMHDMEAEFLLKAIRQYGSIQKVADVFQVDRTTIFRKTRNYKKAVSKDTAG